jgi:hypothetical protein
VQWLDGSGLQALTHQRLGSLGLGWWRGWAVFVLSITFKTEIIFGNLDDDDEGGIYFAGILRSDN